MRCPSSCRLATGERDASTWRWSVPQQPPSTLTRVPAQGGRGSAGRAPPGCRRRVGRLVELGVAALRGVGADAADAPIQRARPGAGEMRGMGAVDHVVGRRAAGRRVDRRRWPRRASGRSEVAVGLDREGDRHRHRRPPWRPATMPTASSALVMVMAETMSAGGLAKTRSAGVVGLGLVGGHEPAGVVAVAARADAAADHDRRRGRLDSRGAHRASARSTRGWRRRAPRANSRAWRPSPGWPARSASPA